MYSAVFAVDPASAADLVVASDRHHLRDAEVMDVDENAYRAGTLKTRLYGIARTRPLPGKSSPQNRCTKNRTRSGQRPQ